MTKLEPIQINPTSLKLPSLVKVQHTSTHEPRLNRECVEYKSFYFQFCRKFQTILSAQWKIYIVIFTMWKISTFLKQLFSNYLTVDVLFIQLILHIVEQKLFDFQFFGKCKTIYSAQCIVQSLPCNFHNVENSNCTFRIAGNIKRCFSSTKLS